MKLIGRISKQGKEYLQTAIREEGNQESTFIPVFLKKGLEKFSYKSKENKVDKAGNVYTLYEVEDKNVFIPEVETKEDGTLDTKRAILMK